MTDAAQEALVEMVAVDLAASLAAAISLLEKGGKAAKKAAASDKMFDMMLADYRASLDRARAFFKGKPKCGLTSAMTDLTDEQITAGWLPHDGGPCPVNPLTTVEIMLRGGEVSIWNEAGRIVWQYDSPIGEIGGTGLPYICEVIAYRLPDLGTEWDGPLTAEEQSLIDRAWEKHRAAAPNVSIQDYLEQLNLTGAQCEGVMALIAAIQPELDALRAELAAVNLQLQERISDQSERIKALEAKLATARDALAEALLQIEKYAEFFCEEDFDPTVDQLRLALDAIKEKNGA